MAEPWRIILPDGTGTDISRMTNDEIEAELRRLEDSALRKQTRKASLVESMLNVAIGYGIALGSQIIVFPWFGIHIPLSSNIAIGLIFTAVSIGRSFAVRRLFEILRVRRVLP